MAHHVVPKQVVRRPPQVGPSAARIRWHFADEPTKQALCFRAGFTVQDPAQAALVAERLDLAYYVPAGGYVTVPGRNPWAQLNPIGVAFIVARVAEDTARLVDHPVNVLLDADARVAVTSCGALWWPVCPRPNGYNWPKAQAEYRRIQKVRREAWARQQAAPAPEGGLEGLLDLRRLHPEA